MIVYSGLSVSFLIFKLCWKSRQWAKSCGYVTCMLYCFFYLDLLIGYTWSLIGFLLYFRYFKTNELWILMNFWTFVVPLLLFVCERLHKSVFLFVAREIAELLANLQVDLENRFHFLLLPRNFVKLYRGCNFGFVRISKWIGHRVFGSV